MDLVLFGMQGSGKGTQAAQLVESCDLVMFETGAELRRLAKEESELGAKVKSIIEAGHLVPSEVVMEIIEDFISNLPEGKHVLFDGIPRSEEQRDLFNTLMKKEGREFMGLLIDITEKEALERLTTRRICVKCKTAFPAYYDKDACEKCGGELITRKDDTPDAIRVRLDTFLEKTIPVIDGYKHANMMITVDGKQSIEAVNQDVMEVLKPHFLCQ